MRELDIVRPKSLGGLTSTTVSTRKKGRSKIHLPTAQNLLPSARPLENNCNYSALPFPILDTPRSSFRTEGTQEVYKTQ